MTPHFWHGKRVLLTGHTGFKGSWMSLWLQSLKADVVGFALSVPTDPSLFDQARVGSGMRSIAGDVRDLAPLQDIFREHKPEIVFHMAAQSLVRESYSAPVDTYSTNIMGVVNVLEAARVTRGVKAIVNVTTDKCYENREWNWGYRENEPMGGRDPYSSSKGCAELVTAAYRASFFNADSYSQHGVALATARAGNVIGGGDWARDRLIPDILAAFQQGEIVNIRSPHAVRPWQHVLEPLSGYLTLAEYLYKAGSRYADSWNFGPDNEDAKPVNWIVKRMADMWGGSTRWQVDGSEQPHEAACLKLDISKARAHLGWRPLMRLDDALKLTVDWAKQLQNASDIRKVTLDQIQTYQTLTQVD